jgi:GNAT superfamily N-acetyltransferase
VDLRLTDNRPVIVRPIRPEDKALLQAGLRMASPESIRRRFLAPKPRLTSGELRLVRQVDSVRHYALVAVAADDPRCLLAVGRWVRDAHDPRSAEVAIIVGDSVQRQGLGTHLALALADAARERGVHGLTATMLADKLPAHRLLRRMSARLAVRPQGTVNEAALELAA